MKSSNSVDRWQQVEAIFHELLESPVHERRALAEKLTSANPQLLGDVMSLLAAAERSSEFLEDSQELCTSISDVIAHWKHKSSTKLSTNVDSTSELVTQVDGAPEIAAALSLPARATIDFAREYFRQYRPEFQILEQVGEGAAGIVIKARDTNLDRYVAIKILHRAWADRLGGDALSREAVAASLSNDHIVRVYEVSPSKSPLQFILMEWIDGPSLREHLSQRVALSAREAARFALQIAQALVEAQQRSIVHGDIKPANVMLESIVGADLGARESSSAASASESYRVKLADFGLAQRTPAEQVPVDDDHDSLMEQGLGGFAGTPAYASPEQLLGGKPASQLSDIWAIGATLYHMLCGAPPYPGRPHAIAMQMRHGSPAAPRQLDPRIPRDLESICMKALSLGANQRYPSARHLVEDLNRYLDGRPVMARPVRWPGKLARLVARRPLAAGLLFCLFFSLLAGVVVSNHYRLRAVSNLQAAVESSQVASTERDNALTVINLLKSMISASDANYGRPDIKVIDALRGMEQRLETQLSNKPAIDAEVRSSLAAMYFSVADYESALRQYEKAVELRGAESHDAKQLNDQLELANTLRWLYRPEDGQAKALHFTKISEDVLGPHHATTLYGMEVLAGCYRDIGKLQEARELLERVISITGDSEKSLAARSSLASVMIDLGQGGEAEARLREIIALRKQLNLTDSRESVVLDSNLCIALVEQGKIAAALEMQRATAERATQLLGKAHDLTLGAWLNLADTLRRNGQIEESMAINQQLWSTCRAELGAADPRTLDYAESVILNHVRQKEFGEALRLTEDTLTQVAASITPEHDWHQRLVALRCVALSGLGRAREAVPIHQRVAEHFETKFGSQSALALVHKSNFGLTLIEAGEYERAEKLYRAMLADALGTGRYLVERNLKRNLGLVLVRSGQVQAARELLETVQRESLAAGEIENAQKCEEYLSELDNR